MAKEKRILVEKKGGKNPERFLGCQRPADTRHGTSAAHSFLLNSNGIVLVEKTNLFYEALGMKYINVIRTSLANSIL
uniref:Uncharacterized protein n=1 Tax=Oryza glumipatula TaxID=40148 RepID=A0A0E0B0P0_9ORYZ